ncbi:MAG: Grx4 family monothiol glutaredoxin [Myxococcales bacterium]|nr:Grx4 family monothiol glutaredoxin [Myxococcales bacterium]
MSTQEALRQLVQDNEVILFMKGTRSAPQCGFSATVVGILDDFLDDYATVNVLADPDVRAGIKEFSSWPTIPQLYVRGEFVGGCDIVLEMNENGELEGALGVKRGEIEVPEIFVTPPALKALRDFAEGADPCVRLEIGPSWQYGLDFDDPRPRDVVVKGEGWTVLLAPSAARKVDGLTIDFVEGPEGSGFKLDNPNEPAKVKQLPAKELASWMEQGKPMVVFDVRTAHERATAAIPGTVHLTDRAQLEDVDRGATVVFTCHHGSRSHAAAQEALQLGFEQVYNLIGGIDAWSTQVDPSVPRY